MDATANTTTTTTTTRQDRGNRGGSTIDGCGKVAKIQRNKDDSWRTLMEPTRLAARDLVTEGKLRVLQRKRILTREEEYRGPIRLQLGLTSPKSSSPLSL